MDTSDGLHRMEEVFNWNPRSCFFLHPLIEPTLVVLSWDVVVFFVTLFLALPELDEFSPFCDAAVCVFAVQFVDQVDHEPELLDGVMIAVTGTVECVFGESIGDAA